MNNSKDPQLSSKITCSSEKVSLGGDGDSVWVEEESWVLKEIEILEDVGVFLEELEVVEKQDEVSNGACKLVSASKVYILLL